MASVTDFDSLFQAAGKQYGIDPDLLKAQATIESHFNPSAVGPNTPDGNAVGVMQMMPDTAKSLGIDPTKPDQSIYGAAALMRQNLDRYGNVETAVAAYHGGTDPQNWGPKTTDYVGKVSDAFGKIKQSGGFLPAPASDQQQPQDGPSSPADQMLAALSGQNVSQPVSAGPQAGAPQTGMPQAAAAPSQADLMLSVLSASPVASGAPGPTPSPAVPAQQSPAPIQDPSTQPAAGVVPAKYAPDTLDDGSHFVGYPGPIARNALGLAKGLDDVGSSLVQGAAWVGNKLGLVPDLDRALLNADIKKNNETFDARTNPTTSAEGTPTNWGRVVGNIAGTVAALPEVGPEQLGNVAARIAGNPELAAAGKAFGQTGLGTAITNAIQGAGGAALSSSQSDLPLSADLAVGGAAGAIVPPLAKSILGPEIDWGVNAVRGVAGKFGTAAGNDAAQATQDILSNHIDDIRQAITIGLDGAPHLDFSRLPNKVTELLDQPAMKTLTPEQQERVMTYAALGVKDFNLADVTRDPTDAMMTRNLAQNAEAGAPLRAQDVAKNQQLLDAANQAGTLVGGKAGDAYSTGEQVRGALSGMLQGMNQRISGLYQQADAAAQGAPQVATDPISSALQDLRSRFLASGDGKGLLNGIRARLQDFSGERAADPTKVLLWDADGSPLFRAGDIPQKMTMSDSEAFRQYLNDVSTPDNYSLIKPIKAAVDAAQDASGTGGIYADARALRAARSRMFEDQDGVAKVLADKTPNNPMMPVDRFLDTYVFNKGNAAQLQQVTNMLKGSDAPEAQQAFQNLRATTLQSIVDKSTGNTPNAAGQGTFSGLNFQRQLDSIGDRKLSILFSPGELGYLKMLAKGSIDLTTDPVVRNGFNPSGTASQVVNMLQSIYQKPDAQGIGAKLASTLVGKIPVVGKPLSELGAQAADRAAAKAEASQAQAAANPLGTFADKTFQDQTAARRQALANLLTKMRLPAATGAAFSPSNYAQ